MVWIVGHIGILRGIPSELGQIIHPVSINANVRIAMQQNLVPIYYPIGLQADRILIRGRVAHATESKVKNISTHLHGAITAHRITLSTVVVVVVP